VRVCTGTACFATDGGALVDGVKAAFGLELGERREDGSVSLAETVCLGFCHSSPALRDGDLVDAGPGVIDRVLAAPEDDQVLEGVRQDVRALAGRFPLYPPAHPPVHA